MYSWSTMASNSPALCAYVNYVVFCFSYWEIHLEDHLVTEYVLNKYKKQSKWPTGGPNPDSFKGHLIQRHTDLKNLTWNKDETKSKLKMHKPRLRLLIDNWGGHMRFTTSDIRHLLHKRWKGQRPQGLHNKLTLTPCKQTTHGPCGHALFVHSVFS